MLWLTPWVGDFPRTRRARPTQPGEELAPPYQGRVGAPGIPPPGELRDGLRTSALCGREISPSTSFVLRVGVRRDANRRPPDINFHRELQEHRPQRSRMKDDSMASYSQDAKDHLGDVFAEIPALIEELVCTEVL